MTPSLFDLPLRLSDAVSVAALLLDLPGVARPITNEQRTRIAARATAIEFTALKPHFASLERDPIHPSAYYLCVDGADDQPLLLRSAPATTPSSGLFPKSILIGRSFVTPPAGSRAVTTEMVLNAIPFGPADETAIQTFADKINIAFRRYPDPTAKWAAIRAGAR